MKNDGACVITAMDTEAGTAEIIVPQIDETPQEITLDKLNEEYMGFAFFLKRLYVDSVLSMTMM